jgi:DNA-directed RNA polymerase subunit M/transcription elongation factor TFIIS
VDLLFEFCEKCGSIMLPAKDGDNSLLECSLCAYKKKITEEIHEDYVF